MSDHWLSEAVSNNAAWGSAMATSHGIASSCSESIWFNKHPMPAFYPNIVTLKSHVEIDQQIADIDPHLPAGWGIKDSYKELQLQGKGFSAAFDAYWYCHEPHLARKEKTDFSPRLEYVTNSRELNQWIEAWGQGTDIFKPSLLCDETIELAFIKNDDGLLVSGLAINLSGESVGISNAFGKPESILACIDEIGERHSGRAIVGYGDKSEVHSLSKVGFRVLGELRVWLRD